MGQGWGRAGGRAGCLCGHIVARVGHGGGARDVALRPLDLLAAGAEAVRGLVRVKVRVRVGVRVGG